MDRIPREILCKIFLFLPDESLAKSCLVCRQWSMIISDNLFWRQHCIDKGRIPPSVMKNTQAAITYCEVYKSNIFKRNLLKNGNAVEKVNHWQELQGEFHTEDLPVGGAYFSLPETDDPVKCWATNSHHNLCCKSQVVDLIAEGAEKELMDEVNHPIQIEDWYAGRFDVGCEYRLRVKLCNENKEQIDVFDFEDPLNKFHGKYWRKVTHTFVDYPVGVRYVTFTHMGKDYHNGCKLTMSSVRFAFE